MYNNTSITNKSGNNCFLTKNITGVNDDPLIKCQVLKINPVDVYPCNSLNVGLCFVELSTTEIILRCEQILRKCVMLPFEGKYLCIPFTSHL